MGSVFGKESVKEPPHEILLSRNNAKTSYELRKYGQRFAATITYKNTGDGSENSPFGALAKYIGVFGSPQNDGSQSIAMTAPVVMENSNNTKEGVQIAMTAPVVMGRSGATAGDNNKKMMFMLPEEYDTMDKIPKPTNPLVHIEEIPSNSGVVHVYNGRWGEAGNARIAKNLADQLIEDGVPGMTEEYVMQNWQFWGYNPPFTIPYFRRNEVWVQLKDEQSDYLVKKFKSEVK
jgi:hypothetical protein